MSLLTDREEDFVSASSVAAITEILGTLDEADQDTVMTSMHDNDGMYTYASGSAEKLFGYKPRELVGRNAWVFIHPDDNNDARASQIATQSGHATKVRYRIRHADGHYVPVESVAWDTPEFGTVVVTKLLD